jgi:WD40 repeat protein
MQEKSQMIRAIGMIPVLMILAVATAFGQAPPVDLPDVQTNSAGVAVRVKELSTAKHFTLGFNYPSLSPDGKLATGGYTVQGEGSYTVFYVQMLSTASGNSLMSFRLPFFGSSPYTAYAVTPNGSTLAAFSNVEQWVPAIRRFDLTTQKEGDKIGTCSAVRQRQFMNMRFSADGTLLAVRDDKSRISVWSNTSGRMLAIAQDPEGIAAYALSPDNKLLAGGIADRTIKVYDSQTCVPSQTLEVPDRPLTVRLDFTPDGKYLVSAGDGGKVLFWDTKSWKLSRTIPTNAGKLNDMAISSDGKLLFTAHAASLRGKDDFAGTIRIWDVGNGALAGEIRSSKPGDDFLQVAISQDGKTLAGYSGSSEVHFWRLGE